MQNYHQWNPQILCENLRPLQSSFPPAAIQCRSRNSAHFWIFPCLWLPMLANLRAMNSTIHHWHRPPSHSSSSSLSIHAWVRLFQCQGSEMFTMKRWHRGNKNAKILHTTLSFFLPNPARKMFNYVTQNMGCSEMTHDPLQFHIDFYSFAKNTTFQFHYMLLHHCIAF